MMKHLITALLLFTITGLKAQDKTLKAAQYSLINYFFDKDLDDGRYKLDVSVLSYKNVGPGKEFDLAAYVNQQALNDNIFNRVNVDTLLTEKDYQFMAKQIKANSNSKQLDLTLLKIPAEKLLLTDNRTEQQLITPDFKTYRICLPLFSRSYQVALFYQENYCGGDCAGGQINIMRRQKDGSWKFLGAVMVFIS